MTPWPSDRACGGPVQRKEPAANDAQLTPYLQGAALCNGCGHDWQAVTPAGTHVAGLECPECHAFKGVLLHHVQYDRPGAEHWQCVHCRGVLFAVLRLHDDAAPLLACANCGGTAWAAGLFP